MKSRREIIAEKFKDCIERGAMLYVGCWIPLGNVRTEFWISEEDGAIKLNLSRSDPLRNSGSVVVQVALEREYLATVLADVLEILKGYSLVEWRYTYKVRDPVEFCLYILRDGCDILLEIQGLQGSADYCRLKAEIFDRLNREFKRGL